MYHSKFHLLQKFDVKTIEVYFPKNLILRDFFCVLLRKCDLNKKKCIHTRTHTYQGIRVTLANLNLQYKFRLQEKEEKNLFFFGLLLWFLW
jgi:hypothetical protein